jgi:hypothetical protein
MVMAGQIGGGVLLIVIGIILITAVLIPVTVQQVSTLNDTGLNCSAVTCNNLNSNTRTILGLYELFEALMGLVLIAGGGFVAYSGARG